MYERRRGYDRAIQGTLRRLVLAAALLAALAVPSVAQADGVDQTCQLTATRFDPDTANVLYPDSSAQYWSATYTAVPGTRIRIDGIYPYARYITFSAGDHPGPNTIYVDPSQHPSGLLTLRVYEPDSGRDVTGGVGLPQITWESTSATGPPSLSSPCQNLEKPTSSEVTGAYAGQSGPSLAAPYPGQNPPDWHKFVNICQSGADLLFDNAFGDELPQSGENPCSSFGSGGFLSNLDNAYMYSFISQGFGPIVVFHGQAPTFAATYPDAATMPGGVQVRYWSFCQNDPFSERYVGCLRDDQVVQRGGDYTIVVAPPGDWPAAAQQRCQGTVSSIPWGPQPQGVVLYRQMLPDPSFAQAIANVSYGSEAAEMGAYYPAGRYFADWQAVAQALCPG